jgi:hypothetical protein
MLGKDLVVTPTTLVPTELASTEGHAPAIIQGSGRKARDRIEHFLRAAIDNDNTRRAYDRRKDRVTLDEVVKINIRG